MATLIQSTNIIKMNDEYFLKIKNHFTESRETFDCEMCQFINKIKDIPLFDIKSNWTIQLPMIKTHKRHLLHTFERSKFITLYSIGHSIKGERIMIIEPTQEYISYIIKTYKLKENPKLVKQMKLEKLIEDEIAIFKFNLISKIKLLFEE